MNMHPALATAAVGTAVTRRTWQVNAIFAVALRAPHVVVVSAHLLRILFRGFAKVLSGVS